MKCPLCGYQFLEEDSRTACDGCPLSKACHVVKCPNCGYKIPMEPRLIKAIKAWRRREDGTSRKS